MKKLYVIDKKGKRASAKLVKCDKDSCNNEFLKSISAINSTKHNYCSVECSRPDLIEVECAWCNNKLKRTPSQLRKSKSGLYFCNAKCKNEATKIDGGIKEVHPSHYNISSLYTYRDVALRKYPNRCNKCGYDDEVKILEVHHIDMNRKNNTIENLEVLCPNCHRMEHL